MARHPENDKHAPPAADPRSGRNPGYAEDQPRDVADTRIPTRVPIPSPDEPGIERDNIDEQADPAKH